MPVTCYSGQDKSPSPTFRGEREGPVAKRWEGEVGQAANRPGGPPHLQIAADSLALAGRRAGVRDPRAFCR